MDPRGDMLSTLPDAASCVWCMCVYVCVRACVCARVRNL